MALTGMGICKPFSQIAWRGMQPFIPEGQTGQAGLVCELGSVKDSWIETALDYGPCPNQAHS